MQSIHLSDQVYVQAKQLASARGFDSVEDFISDVVKEEAAGESENLDHLFTPEVMAAIDRGIADIKAGRVFTEEQVKQHMIDWREEWQKDQAS